MRKLFHSIGVVSLLAFCAVAPTPGHAQTAQPAPDNTFSGAVAPAHNPGETKQPEGYRGVLPGHVAPLPQPQVQTDTQDDATAKPTKRMPRAATKAAEDSDTPPARTPRKHAMSTPDRGMTERPGFEKHKTLTADDLKQIAAMTGIEIHMDQMPDNMANAIHMPSHVYPLVSLPSPRIDGMLPLEFSAKQMVDKEMQDVSNASNLSPEAHKKAVSDALVVLNNFAHSARVKRDMPSEIYQAMGVPTTYINESHESSAKAAERLEAAIKILQGQEQQ